MPTPTQENAQRLNELSERLTALAASAELRFGMSEAAFKEFKETVTELTAEVGKLKDGVRAGELTDARHDERLKAVEKGHDRLWQIAPMVISVAAILVSVFVAFLKK